MLASKLDNDYISEAEYLEGEKYAPERHEYVDGAVYAMAGATRRHNDIAVNLTSLLRPLTRGTPCKVNSSDVKVRAAGHKTYYYPDVIVGCEADDNNEYYLEKPCLIIEVTSKSTEWKDRHEKVMAYQTLDTLQAYLVVAQDKPHVTMFYREQDSGNWWVKAYEGMETTLPIPCPELEMTLADVYEGVDFSKPEE